MGCQARVHRDVPRLVRPPRSGSAVGFLSTGEWGAGNLPSAPSLEKDMDSEKLFHDFEELSKFYSNVYLLKDHPIKFNGICQGFFNNGIDFKWSVPHVDNGEKTYIHSNFSIPLEFPMTVKDAILILRGVLLHLLDHEVMEFLRYRGLPVYDPHDTGRGAIIKCVGMSTKLSYEVARAFLHKESFK